MRPCFQVSVGRYHMVSLWLHRIKSFKSSFTHPARSGDRTAGSQSAVWLCSGWGRRRRCKNPHAGSLGRAPVRSSPPSTPGGPHSAQPARTRGDVDVPSCRQGKCNSLRFCRCLAPKLKTSRKSQRNSLRLVRVEQGKDWQTLIKKLWTVTTSFWNVCSVKMQMPLPFFFFFF